MLIRRGEIAAHKRTMIGAVVVSALFLISYLTYHAMFGSRPFPGEGTVRAAYLVILLTHTILAAALVPMVLVTLRRGLMRNDTLHKRIARWTYPFWVYVSFTGVIIYVMLYRVYPLS